MVHYYRPGQLSPQMGRDHQGTQDPEEEARGDPRGHECRDFFFQNRPCNLVDNFILVSWIW